ncbi:MULTISPECIES: biotin/lipoyl-binding carrier protein [Bordetella]|uniref:Acetyl-CoA carboxylase biotin carboxyl carrier protein subunit n=2 Tax=Bordetella TaxID=517 RepID=A0A261W8E5_9BORD|nr:MULTISPECIES: biotin/lipoyl-binding carrier protein [Bordetella]MDM9558268.1 biotin/lipoyl-binding carrier protein [Bordetella petrii]OZI82636.1 acetyl-CoA carboxylase biotin carboxyl carrier protein subunit [Bordetella genomosp. 2]
MGRANVVAEVTGTVWKIQAEPGAAVQPDDVVMLVESMKMEIPVVANDAGRIAEILVREGEMVQEGQTVAVVAT